MKCVFLLFIFCHFLGNKDALQNLPQAVRNTTSMLGAHSDKKKVAPKKGALMVKTLKMLKCKNRK